MEDAYDWLCCLADNALTAGESERVLQQLTFTLDTDRSRVKAALQETIASYTDQHNRWVHCDTAAGSQFSQFKYPSNLSSCDAQHS